MIILATDGSCANQRKQVGGWAVASSDGSIYTGYEFDTTSQRCEILAVYNAMLIVQEGLEKDEDAEYAVVIDSAYVANCIKNTWFRGWQRNGWVTSTGSEVKNRDLWSKIAEVYNIIEDHIHVYLISGHIQVNKPDKLEKALGKFKEANVVLPPMNVFLTMAKLNRDADELAVSVRKALEFSISTQ